MKLFKIDVMDDCEMETVLAVAENKEEAIEKASKMDWPCFMTARAYEVNEIDGYKVVFKKGKKIVLEKSQ